MIYEHRIQFQELLQQALELAMRECGHTNAEMVAAAGLSFAKSTLGRFRVAKFPVDVSDEDLHAALHQKGAGYLNPQNAEQLWEYLSSTGYIDRARERIRKTVKFFDNRHISNSILEFFACSRDEFTNFKDKTFCDTYFCYKPSFRKEGCVIKSQIKIVATQDKYFEVSEYQRSSERYEIGGYSCDETSVGFGFIKSGNLWLILKEESELQPRLYCFDDWDITREHIRAPHRIVRMKGRLIESDKKFKTGVHGFRVGLASLESDQRLWNDQRRGQSYIESDQIDNFPFTDAARKKYHGDDRLCLDEQIMAHIRSDKDARFTNE